MADLPIGSTAGGSKIIHKGVANNHRHSASQIIGLNPIFTGDVGIDGGIDANLLSGKNINDLDQELLRTNNDSIDRIRLSSQDSTPTAAVSVGYLKQTVPVVINANSPDNVLSRTYMSDSVESNDINVNITGNTIALSSTVVFINGIRYLVDNETLDISALITDNPAISLFPLYATVSNEKAEYQILTDIVAPSDTSILLGHVLVSNGLISSFNQSLVENRFGIEGNMLSRVPIPYGIPIADSQGKIDDEWFPNGRGEGIVSLLAFTTGPARVTFNMSISDFDAFSEYDVSVDIGDVSFSSPGNIAYIAPNIAPEDIEVTLTVTRNNIPNDFTITIVADPPVTLSGPAEVVANGVTYTYTIGSYYPDYTYTAILEPELGNVIIDGNQLIYTSPTEIPENTNIDITIEREGSSYTLAVSLLAGIELDFDIFLSSESSFTSRVLRGDRTSNAILFTEGFNDFICDYILPISGNSFLVLASPPNSTSGKFAIKDLNPNSFDAVSIANFFTSNTSATVFDQNIYSGDVRYGLSFNILQAYDTGNEFIPYSRSAVTTNGKVIIFGGFGTVFITRVNGSTGQEELTTSFFPAGMPDFTIYSGLLGNPALNFCIVLARASNGSGIWRLDSSTLDMTPIRTWGGSHNGLGNSSAVLADDGYIYSISFSSFSVIEKIETNIIPVSGNREIFTLDVGSPIRKMSKMDNNRILITSTNKFIIVDTTSTMSIIQEIPFSNWGLQNYNTSSTTEHNVIVMPR